MLIRDLSSEQHCGEEQNGNQHPVWGDPENRLGERQVRADGG